MTAFRSARSPASPPPPRSGRTLLRAALAFAVLCAAVVLLIPRASPPEPEPRAKAATEGPRCAPVSPLRPPLREATAAVEDARDALESTNYGRVRRQLFRAERSLEKIHHRVQTLQRSRATAATP